ncbi:hypothetical protein [Streptomyces griseoaurantiacus]|uniref:hypothetical protein n=1 Tax=Streptomyces griseoaurantiacus TaxID=68213 RepID=UPI00345FA317
MDANLPVAATGAEGEGNGYLALGAKLKVLQMAAEQLLEEAEQHAHRMKNNADAAVQLADLCAAAEVDAKHVAAVADIAEAFGRVVGDARQVSATAYEVSEAAGHARTQHQAAYGGIHAAVSVSGARQARPGFYRQG